MRYAYVKLYGSASLIEINGERHLFLPDKTTPKLPQGETDVTEANQLQIFEKQVLFVRIKLLKLYILERKKKKYILLYEDQSRNDPLMQDGPSYALTFLDEIHPNDNVVISSVGKHAIVPGELTIGRFDSSDFLTPYEVTPPRDSE